MANETSPPSFIQSLTGLRFFAAVAVVFQHLSFRFGLENFSNGVGLYAVSWFFILSGFILTHVYAGRLDRSGAGAYYFRRFARIWPLHLTCLVLLVVLNGSSLFRTTDAGWKLLLNVALFQSWVPQFDWAMSFNGVTWSVAVEVFFYLTFPFLLIGGERKFYFKFAGILLLTAVLVYTCCSISTVGAWKSKIQFAALAQVNPIFRWIEFCIGISVGFAYRRWCRRPRKQRSLVVDSGREILAIGLMLVFAAAFIAFGMEERLNRPPYSDRFLGTWLRYTHTCLPFGLIVWVFATGNGLFGRIASLRPVVFLGDCSYAWYLTHMQIIRHVVKHFDQTLSPVLVSICIAVFSLGLAILLFRYVESPAKSGLVRWYKGERLRKSRDRKDRSFSSMLTNPVTVFATLMLVVPAVVMMMQKLPEIPDRDLQRMRTNTRPELLDTTFSNGVQLVACEMIASPSGLKFEMAFEVAEPVSEFRFMHICDASGEVVGHGPRDNRYSSSARSGRVVIDSAVIRWKSLRFGQQVTIGFFEREKGFQSVVGNRPTVDGQKLIVLPRHEVDRLLEIRRGERGSRLPTEAGGNTPAQAQQE